LKLVTGGAGIIGANFALDLTQPDSIRALIREPDRT